MPVKVTFDYINSIMADKIIRNSYNDVLFVSMIGYKSVTDKLLEHVKGKRGGKIVTLQYLQNNRINSAYLYERDPFGVVQKRIGKNDYIHTIIYRKPIMTVERRVSLILFRDINKYPDEDQFLIDKVYETIDHYSSIPFLKDWTPAFIEHLQNVLCDLTKMDSSYSFQDEYNMDVYSLTIDDDNLKDFIHGKLEDKTFNINGSNEESIFLDDCKGLNDYLDFFGESLAQKIQDNFAPKFVPGKDKYDLHAQIIDDYIHNRGIEKYEAQRAIEQAVANNWKKNNNTLLVGECGAGKTIMGASSCFIHHANMGTGFNALIMCPSHIVEKWKRESELYIPNTKSYIIHNLKELLDLKPKLENPYRTENMFVIMSKETAKLSYEKRPAAIWKNTIPMINKETNRYIHTNTGVFVCPDCGKPLYKEVKKDKMKVKEYLNETDFLSTHPYNLKCPHCETSLWTTLNRDELNSKWIKLGKEGWLWKDHIETLNESLIDKDKLTKKEKNLLAALVKQIENVNDDGEYITSYKGSKKYCVAKYIKDYMSNVFDYGILDEIHELSSKDSIQGQAFHYVLKACKKNIGMTGTLINGFADSIYYILYKMYPNIMKKSGFEYGDVAQFVDKYGVISYTYNTLGRSTKKKLPGVSPLIFTDYLFNSTVFISLKDMKDELPPYTEIPTPVYMDEATRAGYNEYETFMANLINESRLAPVNEKPSLKIVPTIVREMMDYCDSPHCARPIPDPDTEEIRFSPSKLENETRSKEEELLRIIEKHVNEGERCLVYYNSVNKTDIGKKLTKLVEDNGYNAYELKANIKSEKRESTIRNLIDNKGLDVLICNPKLVETGLDLIDFTTVIFYQVGYNLYTLRQASRRSWRLSQKDPVTVYYLYYADTVQERALSLMATKLHAAKSMEGDFDEEGLKAMSENTDILTQIANNVVDGMECAVDTKLFAATNYVRTAANKQREHKFKDEDIEFNLNDNGMKYIGNEWIKATTNNKLDNNIINNPLQLFI